MNGLNLVIVLITFCGSVVCGLHNVMDLGVGEDYTNRVYGNWSENEESVPEWNAEVLPTIYQNVKRYYCATKVRADDSDYSSRLIIFSTNEWRFPSQDVNLTLSYPTSNSESEFVITSMEVFLFYDGTSSSKGYIASGGMRQEYITMEFIIPEISRLYYRFRLQGIAKSDWKSGIQHKTSNMCDSESDSVDDDDDIDEPVLLRR